MTPGRFTRRWRFEAEQCLLVLACIVQEGRKQAHPEVGRSQDMESSVDCSQRWRSRVQRTWELLLWVSRSTVIEVSAVLALHLKTRLAEDPLPNSLKWPLAGFSFSQGLSSLLAVGQRLLPFPCQVGVSAWQPAWSERTSKKSRRGQARWQPAPFCNLISKVTSLSLWPLEASHKV